MPRSCVSPSEKYLRDIVIGMDYSGKLKRQAASRLRRLFGYTEKEIFDLRVIQMLHRAHTLALRDLRRRCDAVGGKKGESLYRNFEMALRSVEIDLAQLNKATAPR